MKSLIPNLSDEYPEAPEARSSWFPVLAFFEVVSLWQTGRLKIFEQPSWTIFEECLTAVQN